MDRSVPSTVSIISHLSSAAAAPSSMSSVAVGGAGGQIWLQPHQGGGEPVQGVGSNVVVSSGGESVVSGGYQQVYVTVDTDHSNAVYFDHQHHLMDSASSSDLSSGKLDALAMAASVQSPIAAAAAMSHELRCGECQVSKSLIFFYPASGGASCTCISWQERYMYGDKHMGK
jgi:hypothetical protein